MTGIKGERRWKVQGGESYDHPPEEIAACMRCHLPDCKPTAIDCPLKMLREQKQGKKVRLK